MAKPDDPTDNLPATSFHDRAGYPIHIGDVLRLFHFVHWRHRRKCYLYRIVVDSPDGPMVATLYQRDPSNPDKPYALAMILRNWEVHIVANHDASCFFDRKRGNLRSPNARSE